MDEVHFKALHLIEDNPTISQRQLARELGVSLGKVNYCIKAMLEKGWIKANNFKNNKNKMSYIYLLTPGGMEAKARLTVSFLRRKTREYERLQKEIAELRKEVVKRGYVSK